MQYSYTSKVASETAHLYQRVKHTYSQKDWQYIAPLIYEIHTLKKEKNAVILAHNYMTPDIYHCVSDVVGDSLALAIQAQCIKADIILVAGVYFMAETAKILNPRKKVLISDAKAGCSLADSITGKDVQGLRKKFPGVPVVTYVNTSADVKAQSDICCTSGNVEKIIRSLKVDRVILIPDKYLAANVEKATGIECISWDKGVCEVHELFTREEMDSLRKSNPAAKIVAHPECAQDVVSRADFSGSTANMIAYVKENKPKEVALITECSMSQNIAEQVPETKFIGMCRMCPHMKRITLDNIVTALKTETQEVTLDPDILQLAHSSVARMIEKS